MSKTKRGQCSLTNKAFAFCNPESISYFFFWPSEFRLPDRVAKLANVTSERRGLGPCLEAIQRTRVIHHCAGERADIVEAHAHEINGRRVIVDSRRIRRIEEHRHVIARAVGRVGEGVTVTRVDRRIGQIEAVSEVHHVFARRRRVDIGTKQTVREVHRIVASERRVERGRHDRTTIITDKRRSCSDGAVVRVIHGERRSRNHTHEHGESQDQNADTDGKDGFVTR